MIYTCIIGVSGYGEVHYNMLLKGASEGKLKIAGAAIINQEEESEKCETLRNTGCEIFTDYQEMLSQLSGKADICFIPTGIPLHKPMTVAALEAGMNVLVEKPVAGTIQDAAAMIGSEKSSGRKAAVGFQFMYSTCTMETKRYILKNVPGDIRCIKGRVLWPRGADYYSRNRWAGKLGFEDNWILDSPFNNAMAHYLMQMLFFAGHTERECAKPVSVNAELYRGKEIESPDTACMRIETDTGVPILFYVTHACSETIHPDLRICTDNGEIRWSNDGASAHLGGETGGICQQDYASSRQRMLDSVQGLCEGGDDFICSLETASHHTVCVNSAHESSPVTFVDQRIEDNGTHVIPGIAGIIDEAFLQEMLFSEIDVAWAESGEIFDCRDYTEFNGGKI